MKINENSVKINEIDDDDDDDDDDCGGDGGSSSILYLKTPDQPPLAAIMLIIITTRYEAWGRRLKQIVPVSATQGVDRLIVLLFR